MPAINLDGEAVAAEIKVDLAQRTARLKEEGVIPGLGTLLVGEDGPSANYVAMKHRDAAELGIASFDEHLPADVGPDEIDAVIDRWNADPAVDAFLCQYPFPAGFDYEAHLLRVDPAKDVDGLHPVNLGKLVMGTEGPLPCTPHGIQRLLVHYGVPIAGSHVVIVGRGLTIGRPLANLLSLKRPDANVAVTVVHTGVGDIGALTRQGDILIAAAGSPGMITADMVKPGAAVVAAGVSFEGKKLVSDVADEVAEVAGWLSPRIGGVGPMTRAMLLANTVSAAERRVPVLSGRYPHFPMAKISDLLAQGRTISFEFFPPKTPVGIENLKSAVEELVPTDPTFMSVTYGAGGSTRDLTAELVIDLNATHDFPVMAHLTCVGHTHDQVKELLDQYAESGVDNILALGGDPPADGSDPGGEFEYACELVELIRAHGADFSIGVAAQPELHPRSPDHESDRRWLAEKLAMADFGVTNFFFDPNDHLLMVEELADLGCDTPVLPGIMLFRNLGGLTRMSAMNQSKLPAADVVERLEAAGDDEAAVVDIAVELGTLVAERLLAAGVPGIHLYTLNRSDAALRVIQELNL